MSIIKIGDKVVMNDHYYVIDQNKERFGRYAPNHGFVAVHLWSSLRANQVVMRLTDWML